MFIKGEMGPVTRSRKSKVKEPTQVRNVLSDMTNMPKRKNRSESQPRRSSVKNTKVCVYSNTVNTVDGASRPEEESHVYDFVCSDSPPRETKNKRKVKRKKKRLSLSDTEDDEEIPLQPKKLRTTVRKKHAPVKKRNNGEDSLEEQKESVSKRQEFKMTDVMEASQTEKFAPFKGIPEAEETTKDRVVESTSGPVKNVKWSKSEKETNDTRTKISKTIINSENEKLSPQSKIKDSNRAKNITSKSVKSVLVREMKGNDQVKTEIASNNEKSLPLREIKENGQAKNVNTSKNENIFPLTEIKENGQAKNVSISKNEKSLPLRKIKDNNQANTQTLFASTPEKNVSGKSFSFRNESHKENSYLCPLENEENSPDVNFRPASDMFVLSPIEQDSRYDYITKRKVNKKKPCVVEFTIDNCFGFDESEDELDLSVHHSGLPFTMNSTPFMKNKPMKHVKQLPHLVLPAAGTAQFCTRLPPLPPGSSNQNALSEFGLGSSRLIDNSAKKHKHDITQTNTMEKYLCVPSKSNPTVQVAECNNSSVKPVSSVEPPVSSEEVTSTVNCNPVADMFGERELESSFTERPRVSYGRPARVRRHSQHSEPEGDSKDEVCHHKRTKAHKSHKKENEQEFRDPKMSSNLN